jgi:LuxR family maltose regulon positive regulatory protein
MDPTPTPLVLTKLHPPALRANAVARPRLLAQASLEGGTGLVLVSAPAGYGKTTFLVEWTRQLALCGTGVAWYALEESDNRPAVFGAYLVAGLQRVLGPESGMEAALQTIRSAPEGGLLNVLPGVINAILNRGQEMVLVLDDYHLVTAPAIHQAVEFLLNHRPENFHLAIGSRSNPPLPLARLRARDGLIELHAADLRFREDETGQFLRETMRVEVPADLTGPLTARVEGWAAGLQLAALSLAGRADPHSLLPALSGGHKRFAEYLLDEVIDRLPEETQSFLLYTSILERLSAPLCDTVLGTRNSAGLLSQLEGANLFLTALDEEGAWYRYHPLFREFLQAWLVRTQPAQAADLQRKASAWFAERGSLHEAVDHAFQSGDLGFAAGLVEQFSFLLIIRSEIATIYEWCAAFPEVMMAERPRLCVFQALALAYQFQRKNRQRVEARLEQAERKLAELDDAPLSSELGELSTVVRTFMAMVPDPRVDALGLLALAEERLKQYLPGDPGGFSWLLISGYCLQALHRIQEAESAFHAAMPLARQAGLYFGMVETTFHLARLAHGKGQLAEVLRICREGQELLAEGLQGTGVDLPALGCLDVAIADALLEQDQLEEAERHLRRGMERIGGGMNPYYLQIGGLVRYRLAQARGRLDEAMGCLDDLERRWPDVQFLTGGLRAQAALRFREDEETIAHAREWLEAYPAGVSDGLPGAGAIGAAELYYQADLVWARLQIAVGDPEMAAPFLARRLERARSSGLAGREIELTLLEAQMYHKLGEAGLALANLERALAAGQVEGYLRIFDQDNVLDDLIHQAARQGLRPGYCERILVAIRASGGERLLSDAPALSRPVQGETLIEPLSEREQEVLRLMAEGASNQAIAERLVITVGTVKSHVNHILSKLGARSRTEAVALARRGGFLGETYNTFRR